MVHVTQSTTPISAKTIQRKWHVIDVKNRVLGRVANEIATLLMGKQKVNYSPYIDNGDIVVVINASHVEVTGRKVSEKTYQIFSGYPGGLKRVPFKRYIKEQPEKIIRNAVSGMLPKNKLRDQRLSRLHVYANADHPFTDRIS